MLDDVMAASHLQPKSAVTNNGLVCYNLVARYMALNIKGDELLVPSNASGGGLYWHPTLYVCQYVCMHVCQFVLLRKAFTSTWIKMCHIVLIMIWMVIVNKNTD